MRDRFFQYFSSNQADLPKNGTVSPAIHRHLIKQRRVLLKRTFVLRDRTLLYIVLFYRLFFCFVRKVQTVEIRSTCVSSDLSFRILNRTEAITV